MLMRIQLQIPRAVAAEVPVELLKADLVRPEIQALILQKALEHGVDHALADYLAKIESNYDPLAKNPNSSARGVYQWINSSWKAFCKGDVLIAHDNIECAMKLLENPKNLSHWTADKNTELKLRRAGFIP